MHATLLVEDFGRDKDIKLLLKTIQPKPFSGDGIDVRKVLDKWIMAMEDYFALVGYNDLSKGIMTRAKINGAAKTWWKLNCQSRQVQEFEQTWEDVKERLKERSLPLNYHSAKMNEFLACSQNGRLVDQ